MPASDYNFFRILLMKMELSLVSRLFLLSGTLSNPDLFELDYDDCDSDDCDSDDWYTVTLFNFFILF